jgi:predicted nuclease of predicted toxin-antitoxin system
MRFIIDMNLSAAWVGYLRAAGHDAIHWSIVGRADAPDKDIARDAVEKDCIVITSDLDFGAILAASGEQRPSVVQLRSGILRPNQVGQIVLSALRAAQKDLEAGALLTIEAARSRMHVLPLTSRS